MTSPTQQLAPALDIDARLTEIERSLNLLLNVTPVNAAEAWREATTDAAEDRDPRRLRVLAARVVAIGKMLDGAGFLEIFESLRAEHRIPARTAWSIAIRVVVGGGSVKDAIYLRGITRILEALAEGSSLDVLFVGKLALDHIPLIQDLLDREVLQAPWVRPRWLDVPGAQQRLDRLRAGASVMDLYEGDVSA
jgi:hypothetical protein